MKIKATTSSHILIIFLAALTLLLITQMAQAQTQTSRTPSWGDSMKRSLDKMRADAASSNLIAQAANRLNQTGGAPSSRANTLSMKMPQKSGLRKTLENFSLSYYHQFLGPTLSGPGGQTYNVFQEAINRPGTGQAPLQSFQSFNLRYQINDDWAVGSTLAFSNGYTEEVRFSDGRTNEAKTEFFNARAYLSLPALRTPIGTFFTTVAYEHPTSSISKEDEMTWGYFISETFALNMPSLKWAAGINGSFYRIHYKDDVRRRPGYAPVQLQTAIVNVGPYLNYRMNDNWQLSSTVIFDWDQKGVQTNSREFGGNLSDRARLTATYFPTSVPYLSSVGVFTQALLNYSTDTQIVGAEFALRF